MASAWSTEGSVPTADWKLVKIAAPMPTITASTSTFTPAETTLPNNPLGQECRAIPQGERNQYEAGEGGELELDQRDEELDRENEEAHDDDEPGEEQNGDGRDVEEDVRIPAQLADLRQDRLRSVDADRCETSGMQEIGGADLDPLASSPKPANERNRMLASALKLVRMKAKVPM